MSTRLDGSSRSELNYMPPNASPPAGNPLLGLDFRRSLLRVFAHSVQLFHADRELEPEATSAAIEHQF